MDKKQKEKLVVVSAKVSPFIKAQLEKRAEKEDRSVSQVIARFLSSHPELKTKKSLALQS